MSLTIMAIENDVNIMIELMNDSIDEAWELEAIGDFTGAAEAWDEAEGAMHEVWELQEQEELAKHCKVIDHINRHFG